MENPAVTQLPEVDALPDGFVDSSREPIGPGTPTPEQEKPPRGDCSVDRQSELDDRANELVKKAVHDESEYLCHSGEERAQKARSFPVALSESETFDDSLDSVGENSDGNDAVARNLDIEAPEKVSGCGVVEAQDQGKFQSQESTEGSLDVQEEQTKEIPISDGDDSSKDKKIATSETKRKNVKRGFKSEKEFLEFTLRYQQVLAERDAALAVREKLESLCRELQRQNKMLMDECKRVSTEGQNLRLDLSTKFQDAIKEVSIKLEQQKDESLNQLKENEMLKIKLKQLADQYVLSQEHQEQELKQKSLEIQIADLKIKQYEEKLVQEQSQMKVYAEQVSQLLETEKNLRLQLTADGEKFQEFQAALLKSNEVFETFKQEIEKMTKSIKDLKKENTFLKSKCEKSDFTLIELVEERERMKKQIEKLKNQKEKLESLCRSLQAERKQNSTVSNSSDSTPA